MTGSLSSWLRMTGFRLRARTGPANRPDEMSCRGNRAQRRTDNPSERTPDRLFTQGRNPSLGHCLEGRISIVEQRDCHNIDQLSAQLDHLDPSAELFDLLQSWRLELRLEHFDPTRIKPRIESVLGGLGFQRGDFQRTAVSFPVAGRCGSQWPALPAEPDVLLLDEPTNHLDVDAQRWMESFLRDYKGTIAIISDRSLLDDLTTRTIAFGVDKQPSMRVITPSSSRIRSAPEILEKQYRSQQREIEKTERWINRLGQNKKPPRSRVASSSSRRWRGSNLRKRKEDDFVPPPQAHTAWLGLRKALSAMAA